MTNADRTLHLRPEHLARAAGACHFFAEARQFHNAIHANQLLGPPQGLGKLLKITLDWLTNTYNPSADIAHSWFQLITKVSDSDEFFRESEELTYRDISYALMEPPHPIDATWTGLALAADIVRQPADDANWQQICHVFFGS